MSPQPAYPSLSQAPERTTGIIWLVGASLLIAASFMLKAVDGRRVAIRGLNIMLPETCATFRVLGINCPGCGLTRTFIAISAGRFGDALHLSPVGALAYVFVLAQIPLATYYLFNVARNSDSTKSPLVYQLNRWLFFAILFALVIQWILSNFI